MNAVQAWVLHLAGSPGTFLAVAVVLALGAVATVLPTQSLVVAVGALLLARPNPLLPLVALAAATVVGMVAGDLLVYGLALGVLRFGPRTHRPNRRLPRVFRLIEQRMVAMRDRFRREPMATIAIGRLVPTGRTATDLLAADVDVPLFRFLRMAALGGAEFAVFCLALASLAGPFVDRYPLAVTVGAVVLSVLVGLAIDAVDGRIERRRAETRRRHA